MTGINARGIQMILLALAFLLPAPFSFCTLKTDEDFKILREEMVAVQIEARDVSAPLVLKAMRKVPRHLYVPESHRKEAYEDHPLPIGEGQTISQPYIVGKMTELMVLKGGEKVLEIGTGSGYQAAILAEIAKEVYSIEIVEELCNQSRDRLIKQGYENIAVRCGDGYLGWPEKAPFDAIIVTAAPDHVPQALVKQLKIGGRLVIPVGDWYQKLKVVKKTEKGVISTNVFSVRFVPMTGKAQKR